MEKRLGFRRILVENTDLRVEHVDRNIGRFGASIAYGSDIKRLYEHSRNGTRALAISSAEIDFKLLESMKDNGTALCIPLNAILTSLTPHDLSRSIYRNAHLVARAKKYSLDIAFITFAHSMTYMCSSIQIIELAKLLGADERYARYSLSAVNNTLVD
jgi:histidinol phosphatase-like PHP family hydrolase